MNEYTTTLTNWEATTSKNGRQYWKMTFAGGTLGQEVKASCWEQGLAMKAMGLYGQQVNVRLEVNGDFVNVKEIAGAGEQLPPAMPQAGTPIGQPSLPGLPQTNNAASVQQFPAQAVVDTSHRDEVNERIARQEAQRTAAYILQGQLESLEQLEQFEEIHRELSKRLYLDANPAVAPVAAEPAPIVPTAETPVEVAAAVNGEVAGAVQVGVSTETPSWA